MKQAWVMALTVGCAALWASRSVQAETTEEILQLAQKGLGAEVLLAAVERSTAGFALSTDQIVQLKQAGVPEKVIVAMLQKKSKDAAAPAAPEAREPAVAGENGTLNLENVDDRAWGYRLDLATRILWIMPSGEENQRTLAPHGGVNLSAPRGGYEVRFAGDGTGKAFNVVAGEKALLLFSRVETEEFEGLYVSVFEKGERRGGGRLAILRQTRKPSQIQAENTPLRISEPKYTYEAPRTSERVVERVLEQPSTTVIYRESAPVYGYPYYPSHYPYYRSAYSHDPCGYPRYYYPYSSSYYKSCGRRSGISVGIGFGF